MLVDEAGRLVMYCNGERCAVRLDLGPAKAARQRERTPSGWLHAGPDRHHCPLCTPRLTARFAPRVTYRRAA